MPNSSSPVLRKCFPKIGWVFLAAFAVKGLYLFFSRQSPFFEPLLLDPEYYHTWALRIAKGDWIGEGVFYGLPLYPYFLAVCYKVFGASVLAVKIIQLFLGLVTLYFIYRIGEKIHSETAGLLAAFLAAFYGPLFFNEQIFIPEALGVPLYAASFYYSLLFWERSSVKKAVFLGLIFGLATLTKAGIFLFVGLFITAYFVRGLYSKGAKRAPGFICLAMFFLTLAPVSLHNWIYGKDKVFLTSHAGFNFYIGNNLRANGTFVAPEGTGTNVKAQIADSRSIAEKDLGRPLKPSEVSHYWSQKAWHFIRENPRQFFKLLLRKLLLFFDAREISDVDDYVFCGNAVGFLKWPWLNFSVLGPLFFLGLIVSFRTLKNRFLVYLWIFSYLAGLVAFFTNARYRLPLLSIFFPIAAMALLKIIRLAKERSFAQLGLCVLILLGGVGVTRTNLVASTPTGDWINAGDAYLKKGDFDAAAGQYQKALQIEPNSPQAVQAQAVLLTATRRYEEAARFYEKLLILEPDNALAYNNLGLWYERQGDTEKAMGYFLKAIAAKPNHAQAHNNLGMVYGKRGENQKALEAFRESLQWDPQNPRTHTNLGLVLYRLGRIDDAKRSWQTALEIDPNFGDAQKALRLLQ